MHCLNNTRTNASLAQTAMDGSSVSPLVTQVKFYVMDMAVPCICGLGLIGNLLSLMVLTTEKLHKTLTKMEISAHIGLMALAVSDFLFCLLVLIFTQVSLKPSYDPGDTMIYFDFLANGLITLFIITSTWLIVVMAAERYIAVCHPLQARKLISLRRTRASVVAVFFICALSTIPIFLERTIEEISCSDGSRVLVLTERSQVVMRLRRIIWAIVYDFIPSAALAFFNICLVVQIRKAKCLREKMTPKHAVMLYTPAGKSSTSTHTSPAQNISFHSRNNRQTVIINTIKSCSSIDSVNAKEGKEIDTRGSRCLRVNEYGKLETLCNGKKKSLKGCCLTSNNKSCEESISLNECRIDSRVNNSPNFRFSVTGCMTRKRPSDTALNSVTATLVAIVILFLILVFPSELMKFSVSYTPADKDQKLIVTYVTNFMQVLNFSLNFLLYCAVNKTFRQTLYGLACCCWLSVQR